MRTKKWVRVIIIIIIDAGDSVLIMNYVEARRHGMLLGKSHIVLQHLLPRLTESCGLVGLAPTPRETAPTVLMPMAERIGNNTDDKNFIVVVIDSRGR
jgi:hypothetical protein